jgi:hypothetical protein
VYYPAEEHLAVVSALMERHPPGTAQWGFIASVAKPGFHHILGEDSIAIPDIVRSAVSDPSAVEVVPLLEAHERERQARDHRDVDG